MRDYTGAEVKALPGSVRVVKKDVPVLVVFAEADGVMDTLEGRVGYRKGDALLTGVEGEHWPVVRERFLRSYRPDAGGAKRRSGVYRKIPRPVWAVRLEQPASVRVAGGTLTGAEDDWLIQYGEGDYGIVAASVFAATYEAAGESAAP